MQGINANQPITVSTANRPLLQHRVTFGSDTPKPENTPTPPREGFFKRLWGGAKTVFVEPFDSSNIQKSTRLANHPDPEQRKLATESIYKIPTGNNTENRQTQLALLDKLAKDPNVEVRHTVAEHADIASEETVKHLLKDSAPKVREALANSIGSNSVPSSFKKTALQTLIQDPELRVRQTAVKTLASAYRNDRLTDNGGREPEQNFLGANSSETVATELFRTLKTEKDLEIQKTMARTIGYFADFSVKEEFQPLLATAIATLKAEHIQALKTQLEDPTVQTRQKGVSAISYQKRSPQYRTNEYLELSPAEQANLFKLVLSDKNQEVLNRFASELFLPMANLTQGDHFTFFKTLLPKVDNQGKADLIRSTKFLHGDYRLEAFKILAKDSTPHIRTKALAELRHGNNEEQTANILRLFFKDPDPRVRGVIEDLLQDKVYTQTAEDIDSQLPAKKDESPMEKESRERLTKAWKKDLPKQMTVPSIIQNPTLRATLLKEFKTTSPSSP